jgi:P-type Mg2+ transporter
MPVLPSLILPKNVLAALKRPAPSMRVSPALIQAARSAAVTMLETLNTGTNGLSSEEAERRLDEYGHNVVAQEKRHSRTVLLARAAANPLVILLSLLAILAFITEDVRAGTVMTAMVLLGIVLRVVQEAKADSAAARLKAMISVSATAVRDGRPTEIPVSHLVPGDVVKLSAGDMIPADVRLLSCRDLFITQASLTGESLPVEKIDTPEDRPDCSPLEFRNLCYLGTSVESGTATGVVVNTGLNTYLGAMAKVLTSQQTQTSFDKGLNRFTWLMIRFMAVMVPLVFLINGLTKHDWKEAFFFSLAVAVGLTPEMLPMIVTVCLSKGAVAMARKKVIVKRLNSIQNLGAMDILCTDKTGTLTMDHVILEKHCDVFKREEDSVLELAYLNSHFQTGLKNVLDRAILDHQEVLDELPIARYAKVDEVPFDFSRKLMSVVVRTPEGGHRLICKGAPEAVFARCTSFDLKGQIYALRQIYLDDLRIECDDLSSDGFRVLAIAYRDFEEQAVYSRNDETEMVLKGYVAFLDPPKESAAPAVRALNRHGVTVKLLTGDNELVSRKICDEVGLPTDRLLLGADVEKMSDEQLADSAEEVTLFARLSPMHKQRIIKALQSRSHVVGFLGDGINDSPALRGADVGISVDTATDIAKEAADAILLEKSLMVLEEGVLEGRKVFANILKYIRMGASSNFGNMFSVLGASIFLPFVPMLPLQILTNNLLYDFSQVPIPTDDVDPEQIARPRPWTMNEIARFVLFIGPCSSIFDYVTYFIMLYVFGCWDPLRESLFQTGWFVESLLTQTLIIHIIRTSRVPFLQSRASLPLRLTTVAVMALGVYLPFSPIGPSLGFVPLPPLYWPLLALTLACYVGLTQFVKSWLFRRAWI